MRFAVANLKMKLVSEKENTEYVTALSGMMGKKPVNNVTLIVCPSFPFLRFFSDKLSCGLVLGAQDVFWEDSGAFTGAISPVSLREIGVQYVLVGHSESREHFSETNERIGRKIAACFRNGIRPILCIGETRDERENGEAFRVIRTQLEDATRDVSSDDFRKLIVAYEPRWAIGSDVIPSSDEIFKVVVAIRRCFADRFSPDDARSLVILYGGSVTAERMNGLVADTGISGVLVGRESLNAREFVSISESLRY